MSVQFHLLLLATLAAAVTPAFGQQVVSLFTRKGVELYKALTNAGYRVAEVHGHSRDGDLAILHVEIPRKLADNLLRDATAVDANCYYVINDVRAAKFLTGSTQKAASTSVSFRLCCHGMA